MHCASSVLVLDETYHGFSDDPTDTLKQLPEASARLVVLRTFSKYYSLAGLRIGYACIGEELSALRTFSSRYLGFNRLSEKIALAALSDEEYYSDIASRIRADRALYERALSALEGFIPYRSDANFLLVRHPPRMKETLQRELASGNIVVKFLDGAGLDNCMRITIGTREQNAVVLSSFSRILADPRRVSLPANPTRP